MKRSIFRKISVLIALVMVISIIGACTPAELITADDDDGTEVVTPDVDDDDDAPPPADVDDDDDADPFAPEEDFEFEVEEGDVPPGFYNLADFQELTNRELTFSEAPMLAEMVASGEIPPVEERLPDNPLVFRTLETVGYYGGTLRFDSVNIDSDWHLRHLNSANLIEFQPNPAWDVVSTVFGVEWGPGIFEEFGMSPDGLTFSATIRRGLRWSDGHPVTTDDVYFRINDVFLNTTLHATPDIWLTWGGGETQVNIIDRYSFEFVFAEPLGSFIERFVTLWPGVYNRLMVPAHYFRRYHIDHNSEEEILEMMDYDGFTDIEQWPMWFHSQMGLTGVDNITIDSHGIVPTLSPWVLTEDLGGGAFRLTRNPFFYMVDQEGNQLPYIDELVRSYVSDEEMEVMNIISGATDVSAMTISIESFPVFIEYQERGNYYALPLPAWQDHIIVFGFNWNAGIIPPRLTSIVGDEGEPIPAGITYDPGLAEVYGDVRFSRAMSVALNRDVFNETLFMGLGRPAQVSPRPGTPFFRPEMETAWAQYDPDLANQLLDEMGMIDTTGDGWRDRPDGEPFTMMFEYFVITGHSTPAVELAARFWNDVGIRTDVRLVDVSYWWEVLQPNNVNEATTWWLAGSGANLLQPWFLGPSMLTPLWGRYTHFRDSPDISEEDWYEHILPLVPEWQREMQDLRFDLISEPDPARRIEIGTRMWEIQAEWLPIIGTVTESRSPMILSRDLGGMDYVYEMGFNSISVMEFAPIYYFRNPDRR